MPTFRTAEVLEILVSRPGLQRARVRVVGRDRATPDERAYVLTDQVGEVAVGDHVICNTTAVELGLGTGGWHIVHWNLSRASFEQPGPGHVMKLRYTSAQFDAGTAELEHPDVPSSIEGVPVVVCSVHSQVGIVAAVIRSLRPETRLSVVMTDGAALPLVISDLIEDLRNLGVIDATVTAGHAFGGDLEAVTVASALALAVHVQLADIVIVGMGPGVVGTGTELGTTAIEVASILDLVDALGGVPIMCVRRSDADERERHRGVSHHSLTAARLTHCRPWVAATTRGEPELDRCRVHVVPNPTPDVAAVLEALGIRITTMGRGPADDPEFFAAAAAAANVAVDKVGTS